jgi:hypothetical protein
MSGWPAGQQRSLRADRIALSCIQAAVDVKAV